MAQLIFTNHVKNRIRDRKMSPAQVEQTFYSPDIRYDGKEPETTVFEKQFGSQKVTLIGKQTSEGGWLAISVWIDPPNSGTKDARERYLWRASKTAGFWGKWWITLRRIIGI